jgi:hypothetical protein
MCISGMGTAIGVTFIALKTKCNITTRLQVQKTFPPEIIIVQSFESLPAVKMNLHMKQ